MSRGIRAVLILAAVLGIAAAVLLGGFRIHSIEIIGNERNSSEKIRDDLIYDFLTENTLYFCWKYRTSTPAEDTPYLSGVQAKMLSPTSVRIIVAESTLIGQLEYNGNRVYFDSEGVVQEISQNVYDQVPYVSGVTIEEPVLYQKLTLDNQASLRTVLSITQLLVKSGLIPDSVNFDENGNMTLVLGTVTVELGRDEYLEEKIANLVQLYPEVSSQKGTLNMEGFTGKNEAITFREEAPAVEEEAETESAAPTEGQTGSETLAGVGTDSSAGGEEAGQDEDDNQEPVEETPSAVFMVFDSGGTLRYDARVVNGEVVDSYGNPIAGCYVNEAGNVKDAYWNEIDPRTGELIQP